MNLSDPFPPALVKAVLYSHPPIAERIRAARVFQGSPSMVGVAANLAPRAAGPDAAPGERM